MSRTFAMDERVPSRPNSISACFNCMTEWFEGEEAASGAHDCDPEHAALRAEGEAALRARIVAGLEAEAETLWDRYKGREMRSAPPDERHTLPPAYDPADQSRSDYASLLADRLRNGTFPPPESGTEGG